MRLLVQWTRAQPRDWEALDLGANPSAWSNAPKKPLPVGGEQIDNKPGWVTALNCQGVIFTGYDHYSSEPIPSGGLRIFVWNDDAEDYDPATFMAHRWLLHPLRTDDPNAHDGVNTLQFQTIYAAEGIYEQVRDSYANVETSGGPVVVRPYAEFTPPAAAITRHGIWAPDALDQAHERAWSHRGWREWA